jgi:hypothetical protein
MNLLLFPLKLIFYYPGRLVLWWRYLNPSKGKITESRRHFKEGGIVIAFLTSCGLWAFLIFVTILFLSGAANDRDKANANGIEIQPSTLAP